MAISDKTRKMLWAKSGNRCSICKIELFSNEDGKETLNVGEECHIISSQKSGPRHKDGVLDYDNYDNLILLCRNHHKEIDELTETYEEELVRYIKQNHENWVNTTLNNSIKQNNQTQPRFISRITSGKELLNILADSHAYETDYEEVETEDEADFIGGVLQDLVDYGELCGMVEAYERVKMGLSLSETLKRLEENGYFLFAEKKIEKNNWAVATILIRKRDNPEIIKFEH